MRICLVGVIREPGPPDLHGRSFRHAQRYSKTGQRLASALNPKTAEVPTGDELVATPDGGIVVVGTRDGDVAVLRYGTDCKPLISFGTQGVVTLDLGGDEEVAAVAGWGDATVVVVGTTRKGKDPRDFFAARVTPKGALDPGFDLDGKALVDFRSGNREPVTSNSMTSTANSSEDGAASVDVLDDGTVAGVGTTSIGTTHDVAAVRFTPAGILDPHFG